MAKVKKRTGLTGERNTKGRKGVGVAGKTGKPARKRSGKKVLAAKKGANSARKSVRKVKKTIKKVSKKSAKASQKRTRRLVVNAPVVRVAIKPLDPLRKCGPNTTVQFLYRVDETVDGHSTPHLVFFDRHGWYCEHGRTCPAVGHAKKYNGQIARVS